MTAPVYDSSWNPYFGDEVTYGRELGRVSPEGNIYGQTRFVREWKHMVWWDGAEWRDYAASGQLDDVEDLPTGRLQFGVIYEVKEYSAKQKAYVWQAYFYNSEYPDDPWQPMKMRWDVDSWNDLPIPGIEVGSVHRVIEVDVMIVWTGYYWERLTFQM